MQVLGWPLLLSWTYLLALGENPGSLRNLPYSVRPAFRSCPCKGGGACLLREEYQPNTRTYEEFTYEGKTFFGPKVVRVDTGSCYCSELSQKYFASEDGKCPKLKNFCANVTCRNGGTCQNKMGYFFCDSCPDGFGGRTCSLLEKPLPATMKFAQDVTVVWYPDSDFQHTSKTWFKISVAEPGTEFELWIEYLGITYSIEVPLVRKTDESKACLDLGFEDEVCKTYVKGRAYYTWNLSTKTSPRAAPYNLIFGPRLEKALKIVNHPRDWPFQIYAVKYPPIKISMYNSNTETFVQEFLMWSQVSSRTSGCYPQIMFEGCSTDAERPFIYLSHEFVKIRAILRKRSTICKNLVSKLMQPVEFFEAEDTPVPKRLYNFKNGERWQNDENLVFEQREKGFFKFGSFYTAAFRIEVLGSYMSVVGEELQLHFNAMCFFKISPPFTEVTVEGGSGTHDCSKPLVFRPLQTDDDFDVALFTLRWSCLDRKSPNSSHCTPKETDWGSITYRNLACDRVYRFKLEPLHEYFRLTSPTKSNVGKPFMWTVRTVVGGTRISIKCKNSCVNVNTQNVVELEATESPSSGFHPHWWLYEGNGISPLPVRRYTNILRNKWFLSIRENALKPGTTYRILAEMPLVNSYYPDGIPPFSLLFESVKVIIQDKLGVGTKYPLNVKLLGLYDPTREDFIGKVDILNGCLAQDFQTVRNYVVRSAMIASLYEKINATQRTSILGNIGKITPFAGTLSDLDTVVESLVLVLSKYTKTSGLEDGVSDLISAAGQNIVLAAEVFQNLCKGRGRRCSLDDLHSVVNKFVQAVGVLFQTRDPLLYENSPVSLDWKEIHQQKAKSGVMSALNGLSNVLGLTRVAMTPDFQPFIITAGKITAFSAVGHAKTLQTQLDAFGEIAGATVKLSERSVALMGPYIYAVEVIVSEKQAYSWKPPSSNILHTKFFKWYHRTGGPREIYMDDFGPFEIPINIEITNWDYRSVKGIALRANRSCSTECDGFVALNRLRLPPGMGAVAVEVNPKHFGQIKLLAVQNAVPSYSEMDELKPHRRARIEIKYNNQESISFFYVAVISAKEDVYNYELKVLLSSCAYYESEEWQSQKCAYKVTVKRKHGEYSAVCHCAHLSVIAAPNTSAWTDYILKFPVPKLPYFSDIVLIGTLKDNWYVTAVVSTILVFYIILLCYGGIQDKLDHKKESLMELSDNYPGDTHPYIVIVATGMRCRAGTSSKVGFQVVGSNSRSRPHVFRAAKASTLQVAQDDWFLLFTRYDLGDIQQILVWHTNSGCSTDWYCSQITVYAVYRDIPYAFRVQRWFKIDPKNLDDSRMWVGQVNKIDWEVRETKTVKVFGDRFITSLREKHLWISIFFRHARSRYSRCERVAVLGSLLFCTMLTSIVFFGSGDYVEVPGVGFSLSVEDLIEVVKAFALSLITGSLLAFGTLYLFRASKPKIEPPPLPESPTEDDVRKKGCCLRFWLRCSKCCRRKKKPPPVIYRPVVTEAALKARDAEPVPQKLQNLRIAAWIISFLLIAVMSFFIILYGLRFGKKRSLLWIQSFIGSTVLNSMVFDPLKMAIGAYFLARLGLRAHGHDFSMQIDPYTLWPSPLTYMQRMDRMWCRLRPEYKPPSSRRLLKMSKVRAASDFFREYILYFVFLGILFTFSFFFVVKFNTQGRFLATTTLRRQLSERKTEGVYAPDEIVVANELVDYVNKTFLVALHRHRWYNGELLAAEPSELRKGGSLEPDNKRKGWCIGYLNKLMGVPRIRQQRISILPKQIINANWPDKFDYHYEIETKGIVSPYFQKYFNYSLGRLTPLNEDTRTYKVGWELYNETRDGNLTNLWKHYTVEETQTGAHLGRLRKPFQGQGYLQLLYWTREESARRLFETVSAGWIDNQTRAVMVEVTLYNVHLNMFTQFVVLAERLPAGVFSVRTLVDSSSILIMNAWTNTEMIMTYVLILLLLVYSVYYFMQLSMHGVQAVMSWAGLFNTCTLIVGLTCVVHQNFKKATRSGVFADTLDITPKDKFLSVYAYLYNEWQAQVWSGTFVLLITACATCAIHRLLGYERFTMIFDPVKPLFLMTILVSFLLDLHSSACYDSLGLNDLSFTVTDGFFRSIPYQSLQHISPRDQSIVIFFLPICFIFMKTVLGAVIFYYDKAAEKGAQKIGIMQIFPRRTSDWELQKELDKQDKVLEKKMAVVTRKIMEISKKQKKQKKKYEGELYIAPNRGVEVMKDKPVAGWLESIWGAENKSELADLKEEPFHEAPLPDELLDDPNLQSLLESETSQPPKRPSDERLKEEKKQSSGADDEKLSGVAGNLEDKKLSAGTKESKDSKKPSSESAKGRQPTSGPWFDTDEPNISDVAQPGPSSAAGSQPKKSMKVEEPIEPTEQPKKYSKKSVFLPQYPMESKPTSTPTSESPVKPSDGTKTGKTAGRATAVTAVPPKARTDIVRPKQSKGKPPQVETSQPSLIPLKVPASQPKTPAALTPQKTTPTSGVQAGKREQPAVSSKAPTGQDKPAPGEKANEVQPVGPAKARGLDKWFKPKETPQSTGTGPAVKPESGGPPRPQRTQQLEKPIPGTKSQTPTVTTQAKVPPPPKNQPTSQPLADRPVSAQSKTKPDLVVPSQLGKGPQQIDKSQSVPPRSKMPPLPSKTPPAPTKTPREPKRQVFAPQGQPQAQPKIPPRLQQTEPSKMPPGRSEKRPLSRIPPGRDWSAPKPTDRQPRTEPASLEPKKRLLFPPEVTEKPKAVGTTDSRIPSRGVREPPGQPDIGATTPDMTRVPPPGRRRSRPISWILRNARRLAARQRRSRTGRPTPDPGRPPRPPYAAGPGVPGPSGVAPPRQVGTSAPSRPPTAEPSGEPLRRPKRPSYPAGRGAPIPGPPGRSRPRPPPTSDEPPAKKPRVPESTGPSTPGPPRTRPNLGPRPQDHQGAPRGHVVPGPPIHGKPKRTFFDRLFRR